MSERSVWPDDFQSWLNRWSEENGDPNDAVRGMMRQAWQARARIAEQREAELLEALHRAVDLIDEFGIASTEGFWNLLAKHEQENQDER